jgi:hypothetical protein
MYKIVAGIMRRRIALVGRGVAANGGQNRKATSPRFFRGLQGVGRGDSNHYGARRLAGQVSTTQSRRVQLPGAPHLHYIILMHSIIFVKWSFKDKRFGKFGV